MNRTLLLLLLLNICGGFCAPALADEENVPVNLKCITSMPTTSFIATTNNDEVRVSVIHHNGLAYIPIHQGIIVPADIPLLQKKTEVMQNLGERIEIVFPKANCKKYGEQLYSCGRGKLLGRPDLKNVESPSLLTRKAVEKVYDLEFEKNSVSVGMRIDGAYYSFDNEFYGTDCKFEK